MHTFLVELENCILWDMLWRVLQQFMINGQSLATLNLLYEYSNIYRRENAVKSKVLNVRVLRRARTSP